MAVVDEWATLVAILHDRAPKTAKSLRPPALPASVEQALASMGVQQVVVLREFYSLHGGEDSSTSDAPGSIFPGNELFSIERVVAERAMMIEVWEELTAANPRGFPGGYAALGFTDPVAGGRTRAFIPQYIPVSGSDGYFYFCDTRPGEHHGCIRAFDRDDGDEDGVIWPSLEAMICDVRTSVLQETSFDGWEASTDTGAVFWTPSYRSPAVVSEYLAPLPLEVPYPAPAVSAAGDGPVVDRDLLARAVREQAAADHPSRSVEGGYPVLERVPFVPGFVAACTVFVDNEPRSYIAIVTDVAESFLCKHVPDRGWRLVYRPQTV